MPQMAPMWWTLIMIMSILMLLMTLIMTYFSYVNINKKINNKNYEIFHWKWL
uniref:ATP synthase F0 subunit 8 n=1 Tax=Doratura homophyla TaxID=1671211 RepID=UPI0021D5382A|nr:ATP synthase F0 subunit 8 [Doratura homophyla]UXD78629.1 ATP synthase F0 subunit 8 [Doratura homophyla]